MKRKIIFTITIFFLSFTLNCGCSSKEKEDHYCPPLLYRGASVNVNYNFTINEDQYFEVKALIVNVSYNYTQTYAFESFFLDFFFYHRVNGTNDQINDRYTVEGFGRSGTSGFILELSGREYYELDKEYLEQDVQFFINLTEPILGHPESVSYDDEYD